MANDGRRDLPTGITPKLRTQGTERVPVTTPDGTPVYRVRLWDPVLKRQIERTAEGLDAAKQLLEEFNEAKRRPGRLQAEHARFADVAARYLVAYRVKRDGTARPKSSLAKERACLNVYILPALGNAWIGDLDLPELNATIRHLTLQDGSSASGSTKGTVASVLRRLFAWAREERIIPVNPALELRTGWGGSVRRRVIIPSIPQVLRLAQALDLFKPGLGDVAMVLAFTGLRWEEAVAVPIDNVSLDGQCMKIDRTASESGGRRDVREDLKTRAAERTVMIPDIAMPAVRRLADRGAGPRAQRRQTVQPSDQRRAGRLPRLCHVAPVPQARPGLHRCPPRWDRQLHRARAAARLRLAADRLRRLRRAGSPPDGTQQDRDHQEHLRSPVHPGPRTHPGRHEPGGQPTVRLREPGAGGGRGERCGGLMIRKLRLLALRTVGLGAWYF